MKYWRALLICVLTLTFLLQQAVFTGLLLKALAGADAAPSSIADPPYLFPAVRGGVGSVNAALMEYSWQGWRPATCMPDRCFCEPIRGGLIRQPVNTWSNLAFILVGISVLAIASRDLSGASQSGAANPVRTRLVYPVVYGVAAILVGVGSMWYHMSLAFAGQVLDVISMYLLASFMLLYNLSRMRRMRDGVFLGAYLLLNVVLGYLSIRWPVLRRTIFIALVLVTLASESIVRRRRRPRMKKAYLVAAIVSLVTACTFWSLDITRAICWPASWFQAHAMWHVFMAAVIGFIYLYYRSEYEQQMSVA